MFVFIYFIYFYIYFYLYLIFFLSKKSSLVCKWWKIKSDFLTLAHFVKDFSLLKIDSFDFLDQRYCFEKQTCSQFVPFQNGKISDGENKYTIYKQLLYKQLPTWSFLCCLLYNIFGPLSSTFSFPPIQYLFVLSVFRYHKPLNSKLYERIPHSKFSLASDRHGGFWSSICRYWFFLICFLTFIWILSSLLCEKY